MANQQHFTKCLFYGLILLILSQTILVGQNTRFDDLRERARQNDVDAQNELGIAYFNGTGVRPNRKRAVYWFRRSAELGYAIGTCNLALHYFRGWGVPKDKTLGLKYVFAANALDGLKCHPTDFIELAKPTECQQKIAWDAAVIWLRAHPDFKNNFGKKQWMDQNSDYPINLREGSEVTKFPIRSKKRCY
ncbi:MAG: sel1 repeat family protein [Acidobacteriota bacterium]|nr:MAG: sel1 repeat family protein [Acidobacteriota bacterium]